jgi:tetratricopeptide (TPR) repeat protein
MGIKLKNIVLVVILSLIAVEVVFIIKGNGHLNMLRGRRARLEEAIELSNRGVMLSKRGEYPKALKLLEKARELAPGDSLIGENLKAVYFNFGVSQIHQGKYQEALELSGRGLSLLPEEPALLYARAEAWYGLGLNDSCLSCIGRAYDLNPRDSAISGLLGDLDHRCRQEDGLESSRTGYFDIRFEGGENREMADKILFLLEGIRDKQGALFGWQAQRNISVILYNNRQFSDITSLASWAGAAFDGKIRVPVANYREDQEILERVLTHEFVHALLFEIGGRKFPGWFNEGLAQYQEGQRAVNHVYLPLSQLSGSFMTLKREDAQYAYRASLSAVSFLIEDNGWDMVRLFVDKMGQGGDFKVVFKGSFNMTVEQFDQKWKGSIGK